jgi:hypothetical protein
MCECVESKYEIESAVAEPTRMCYIKNYISNGHQYTLILMLIATLLNTVNKIALKI